MFKEEGKVAFKTFEILKSGMEEAKGVGLRPMDERMVNGAQRGSSDRNPADSVACSGLKMKSGL